MSPLKHRPEEGYFLPEIQGPPTPRQADGDGDEPQSGMDHVMIELRKIHIETASTAGRVSALQVEVSTIHSKLNRVVEDIDRQKKEDAEQTQNINVIQENLLAVKAKQVGWGSLAWALGVGAFYLIQMLLGGAVPVPGQPPNIRYLPAPSPSPPPSMQVLP